ncbi:MAG: hypothetical protein DCC55_39825 [Chloroflexi bacterium]|nr:MAG: hypothetical protein DCC55_39825 [Chloroflexota bacterium]
MERFTRITVPLSKQEWEALRNQAQHEYRHPREQARYLIRCALLGDTVPTKDNTGAKVSQASAGVAETAR